MGAEFAVGDASLLQAIKGFGFFRGLFCVVAVGEERCFDGQCSGRVRFSCGARSGWFTFFGRGAWRFLHAVWCNFWVCPAAMRRTFLYIICRCRVGFAVFAPSALKIFLSEKDPSDRSVTPIFGFFEEKMKKNAKKFAKHLQIQKLSLPLHPQLRNKPLRCSRKAALQRAFLSGKFRVLKNFCKKFF